MRLEGTNTLPAPVETVWKTINDPEALRRCTPGLKELKEIGPDTYQATLTIGIAAVKGTYAGTMAITEKRPPTHYKISLDGSGGAGFMKGEGTVDLEPQGDGTAQAVPARVHLHTLSGLRRMARAKAEASNEAPDPACSSPA